MATQPITSLPTTPTITGPRFTLAQAFVDLPKEAGAQSERIGRVLMASGNAAARIQANEVVASWLGQGFDPDVLENSLNGILSGSGQQATKTGANLLLQGLRSLPAE